QQFASALVSSIRFNINPAYRPTTLSYALGQSSARMLVTSRNSKPAHYVDMVASVRDSLPALEQVVVLGPDWDALVDGGRSVDVARLRDREALLDCDDPINIQYTSGTTGNPKGATLTHHGILNNAASIADVLGYT